MSEKTLFGIIALLLVAIVGVGVYATVQNPKAAVQVPSTAVETVTSAVTSVTGSDDDDNDDDIPPRASTSTQAAPSGPGVQTTAGTYTMTQIALHNSAASCYTAINGSVYDLTPFIGQHPGGSVILSLCGIDGTAGFQAQHGGQRRPESELASLKIGILAR